ncbi:MAG TPA: hypothetical protein VFY81_01155 [Gammaproteobacteria bacterium]|nr:hypothetical protein [Gammaproteobacteria bacterium]
MDLQERSTSLVATISYRGVLAVDLPNGLTTGAVITLIGESEFEFSNGKISRIIDRG